MKVIKEDGCTAFGKVYHKECFKCCVCKRRIDGKFFQKNGKPYCEKDYAVSNHNFHKIIYVLDAETIQGEETIQGRKLYEEIR